MIWGFVVLSWWNGLSTVNEGMIAIDYQFLPQGKEVGYFFAGDAGFSIGKHMLNPYAGDDLSEDKVYFNYRLSR